MTRFLLSLDEAVDTVYAAIGGARRGEIYVPRAPAARMVDVASALIGDRAIEQVITGIRPGEKIHEVMVSDEEAYHSVQRDRWYAILPMLPELREGTVGAPALTREFSSGDTVMSPEETRRLLEDKGLLVEDVQGVQPEELLR